MLKWEIVMIFYWIFDENFREDKKNSRKTVEESSRKKCLNLSAWGFLWKSCVGQNIMEKKDEFLAKI